ncbi:MAG TPA: hypothetical protein PK242_09275 [Ottowia sp.]|nr:hypothetical protein [Ottowia sp.]
MPTDAVARMSMRCHTPNAGASLNGPLTTPAGVVTTAALAAPCSDRQRAGQEGAPNPGSAG